jgi:organic radical activating enzyme
MTYAVKEIFYALQGEGARSGRAAVRQASAAN